MWDHIIAEAIQSSTHKQTQLTLYILGTFFKIKKSFLIPVITYSVSPGEPLNTQGEVPVCEEHSEAIGRGVIPRAMRDRGQI